MKWRKRSRWFFGMGGVLLIATSCLFVWLFLMDSRANVPSNPNGSPLAVAANAADQDADGFAEVDWNYWKTINPDIIAWVNVANTKINYPIMRAPSDDPTFYLHHDIYRNYSVYGVPYLDTDYADNNEPAFNAIIYGHHMDNGSMFSDFAAYSDETYAQEHATICLQTPAGKQQLCVSFVNIINGDTTAKAVQFSSEEAFQEWYRQQRSQAQVTLNAPEREGYTESDEEESTSSPPYVVTFCTCSYHEFSNERTLVVCRPIDEAPSHYAFLIGWRMTVFSRSGATLLASLKYIS